MSVRDHIRADLLDADMLAHLEGCGAINWITSSTWQCQAANVEGVGAEWVNADHLSQYLEASEISGCVYCACDHCTACC